MESYIWDANKEKPIKDDDHGMDTTRYMGAHRDLQPSGMISFVPGIQRG
jgi:hypothetical protein